MTDQPCADVVNMAAYKADRAEYDRRRTERHKRRLLKLIKETELPPFPGVADDTGLGE